MRGSGGSIGGLWEFGGGGIKERGLIRDHSRRGASTCICMECGKWTKCSSFHPIFGMVENEVCDRCVTCM